MARFLVGPTPGTSSSTETVIALSRNSRWNVIANRWDFIANLLDQIKRSGAGRQHDGGLVPRHENFLIGLCQATNWYIEAKRLKLLNCSGQLRFAAIDNEQIGARAKALVRHALGA